MRTSEFAKIRWRRSKYDDEGAKSRRCNGEEAKLPWRRNEVAKIRWRRSEYRYRRMKSTVDPSPVQLRSFAIYLRNFSFSRLGRKSNIGNLCPTVQNMKHIIQVWPCVHVIHSPSSVTVCFSIFLKYSHISRFIKL